VLEEFKKHNAPKKYTRNLYWLAIWIYEGQTYMESNPLHQIYTKNNCWHRDGLTEYAYVS
jgi:hypothetical protein